MAFDANWTVVFPSFCTILDQKITFVDLKNKKGYARECSTGSKIASIGSCLIEYIKLIYLEDAE